MQTSYTNTEVELVAMWSRVLGTSVDRTTHFFDAGGDSFLATKAVLLVRDTWALDVTTQVLFDFPVLADFAALVHDMLGPVTPA